MAKNFVPYTWRAFWQLCFCENGIPSSKRIIGAFLIVSVVVNTWILSAKGYVEIVEPIMQTSLIVGSGLLGLSSVTSIWKHDDKEFQSSMSGEKKDDEVC